MSSSIPVIDQQQCTTAEGDGDGCGRMFEFKSSPGLCAKCQACAKLDDGSPELAAWTLYKQCEGCGAAWRNFAGGLCGACQVKKAAPPTQGSMAPPSTYAGNVPFEADDFTQADAARVKAVIQDSIVRRAEATAVRLKRPALPALSPLATTAALDRVRHGGGPPNSDKIMISMAVRIRTALKRDAQNTDASYGSFAMAWAKSTFMSEVVDESLENVNRTWLKTEHWPLTRADVELRFAGNKILRNGAQTGTVGEVYHEYMCGDLGDYYTQSEKKRTNGGKAGNLPTMPLELYIDTLAHNLRIQSEDGVNSVATMTTGRGKRRGKDFDLDEDDDSRGDVTKRIRRQGPPLLKSMFNRSAGPRGPSAAPQLCDIVQLNRARCTCAAETGEVDIMWPDDNASVQTETGYLSKELFASGATKNIYKINIEDNTYVAKQFINIGSGAAVTAEENQSALESDLIRLRIGTWFLDKFFADVQACGAEIYKDFCFSTGFLVREKGVPSATSSFMEVNSAVWLVEPLRTKSFDKFTGTLQHPTPHTLRDMTFAAFTHYTYETSNRSVVFADLQGSPMVVNKRDGYILFDPMTHTTDENSGVGDHGQKGIDAFVDQHRCNSICEMLNLVVAQITDGDEEGPVDELSDEST